MSDPEQIKTTVAALNQIVREWNLIPAIPTDAMAQRAERNMLDRATAMFGSEATAAAWGQFQRNKGWSS